MDEPGLARPVRVLLVDDNPGDVRLVEEAFAEARVRNRLTVAGRCEEALDRLRGRGEYADAAPPDLVLTAVHLPDGTGTELVEAIEETPTLGTVPVVLLTASPSESSVLGDNRADGYLAKPVDGDAFVELCRSIGPFWLQLVVPDEGADG